MERRVCLNPFEVREVLQDRVGLHLRNRRLNPFEVREVLQDVSSSVSNPTQSQSL